MTMMDEQKSAQRDAMCRDEQTAGSAPEEALSRRSFLAGATIVGAAAFGLGLAGCAVQESEPEPATDPGPVTDANLTPGTYQGSAPSSNSRVSLQTETIDIVEELALVTCDECRQNIITAN